MAKKNQATEPKEETIQFPYYGLTEEEYRTIPILVQMGIDYVNEQDKENPGELTEDGRIHALNAYTHGYSRAIRDIMKLSANMHNSLWKTRKSRK